MGYLKMVDKEKLGNTPGNMINRPAASSTINRRYKKLLGRSMWFKEDPKNKTGNTSCNKPWQHGNRVGKPGNKAAKPEAVSFVPHTPGGELKKLVQDAEHVANGNNKVGN